MLFFDFEVFKYDWLVVAIDPIERNEYVIVNDKQKLEQLYNQYKRDIWVGYNCRDYDQYILKAILCGFNPKSMNDWIITQDRKGWEFSSLLRKVSINLFDVMPNPPVRSANLSPSTNAALYLAVCSLEHCSMEILGGYMMPSTVAHVGNFSRACCQPSICVTASRISTVG